MDFHFHSLHRAWAYWSVLFLCMAANGWSWMRQRLGEPVCCDRFQSIGFPFTFHLSGGIEGRADFLWTGLLLDVAVAWTLAVLLAWIELVWRRRWSQSAKS